MPIRMMSPLPGRVVQVLKDFLYAETQLIDAEENDGIATPQIVDANFYDYDLLLIPAYPACSIESVSSVPLVVQPRTTGQRVDVLHRMNVKFHASVRQGGSLRTMEKLIQRWVNGAMRVLAVLKDGLETSADPTRFGSPLALTATRWRDAASYGPQTQQGDGSIMRTGILPIEIKRTEPH